MPSYLAATGLAAADLAGVDTSYPSAHSQQARRTRHAFNEPSAASASPAPDARPGREWGSQVPVLHSGAYPEAPLNPRFGDAGFHGSLGSGCCPGASELDLDDVVVGRRWWQLLCTGTRRRNLGRVWRLRKSRAAPTVAEGPLDQRDRGVHGVRLGRFR